MSDVYSVEEPAGPLRFTLGHFGLQEFVKKKKIKQVVLLSSSGFRTSGSTQATAAGLRPATGN